MKSCERDRQGAGAFPEFGPVWEVRGIFEAVAGLFFAAVFFGAGVVEDFVGIGDSGEGEGDGAEGYFFGDGLEFLVDAGEEALAIAGGSHSWRGGLRGMEERKRG